MHRLFCVILALLFAASGVGLAASPALAVDDGQIGIQPSDEPDYFHLSLAPGAAADRVAVITNHTGGPTTLLTYAVDGLTTPQGGFGFAAQTDTQKNVGSWAKVDAGEVTVAGNGEVRLPFRLTVPSTATPGDYYGGLVIQSPPVAGKTVTVHGGTAVKLNIVQRQAVRIYLTVAGTRRNELQNGDLSWKQRGGAVEFSLGIRNTGNTTLHPSGSLDIHSGIGVTEKLRFNTPESLLPGEPITLHATLRNPSPVQVGSATVMEHSEAGSTTLRTGFSYVPWGILLGTVAAIGLLTVLGFRLARFLRRARRALAVTESGSRRGPRHR